MNGSDRRIKMPICRVHADSVHDAVDADNEAFEAAFEAKIQEAVDAGRVVRTDTKKAAAERAARQVIYYCQIGGHIKIGYTSQLEKRMRSYPPNTELLAVHPGTKDEEQRLHRQFAVHCSHGKEWYPLVPVVLDHIDRVIKEHGKPPQVDFGAKPVQVRQPKAKEGPRPKGWPAYWRA